MANSKKGLIPTLAILYLAAVGFFIWGIAVGNYKIFPWKQIVSIYEELNTFLAFSSGVSKTTAEKLILDPLENRSKYDFSGFKLRDTTFSDDGFLLISRYNKELQQSVVELFSIVDKKVLYKWVPSLDEILSKSPQFKAGRLALNRGSKVWSFKIERFRVFHPLLTDQGGLIFNVDGPLVKINKYGNVEWTIDRHFHHSLEFDRSGNIVVPIVINDDTKWPVKNYRDDGFAIVSRSGKILKEYSVTNILLQNGYRGLVYGVGKVEADRIHLNDAQPIWESKGIAKSGDVALSIRQLSTVLLFRPYSHEIVWLKTGPWLTQHDVNMLGNGGFSLLGNDAIDLLEGRDRLIEKHKSEIYIYNPIADLSTRPYSKVMTREKIWTRTEGRAKILSNGDAFIEQTNTGRILRISRDRIRWEYVNGASQETVGYLSWSRYISRDDINLSWLED